MATGAARTLARAIPRRLRRAVRPRARARSASASRGSAPSRTASTCSSAPPALATSHDKGWARFYRVIDETGCWAELIPIDGKELWRLTVFDEPLSKADPDFLLRKMPAAPFAYEMLSVSPWERRDYVASSYGRAASSSPATPRMNARRPAASACTPGLEEAVNLGWKLAAMAEGWGGPALLASYEIERRPIAVRNVELATRSYNAIAAIPGWRDGRDATGRPIRPGCRCPSTSSCNTATRTRRSACRTARRRAAMDPRASCPRPGRARARRMPGSTTTARRSTCSATASCCCGSAPIRPTRRALIEAAKARGVPMREVALADPDVAALYETQPRAGAAGRPRRLARQRMPGGCRGASSIASAARRSLDMRRLPDQPARRAHATARAFAIVAETAPGEHP